jgi:uncharacterized protein YutE (UPF0331/DUF86 family)
MTDADLVAKRLALIETFLRELETLAHPEKIADDVREERFVEHTLQLAVQAAIDVASHIVADERLGEPATNQALFTLLAKNGWLTPELGQQLAEAAGFRNVLVHGYAAVDLRIVRDVVEHRLGDLRDFIAAIRGRLSDAT